MAEEASLQITAAGAAQLNATLATAFNPRTTGSHGPSAPAADEVWTLDGGTAWVYRADGHSQLVSPLIIADGFGAGKSNIDEFAGLWEESAVAGIHPWGTQLAGEGRDVIVLGYHSRHASIRTNAQVAKQCVLRAIAERRGDTPLVVGGLSMGGLVTRYALASMERQRMDHQTAVYFSYDTPHRGAWIPISLQVFAHFLASLDAHSEEDLTAMSKLINSDAARELLWRHTPSHRKPVQPVESAARTSFLDGLQAVGAFPQRPLKLAVANGSGDGSGNGVPPGAVSLDWRREPPQWGQAPQPAATLYAQRGGTDQIVAELKPLVTNTVKTSGLPQLDGTAGGTLDSFAIAADALTEAGFDASTEHPNVCFVPSVSAVDIAGLDNADVNIGALSREDSDFDEFLCGTENTAHTLMTEELCTWLSARMRMRQRSAV